MAFVIGNFDAQLLPDDVKTALDEDVPMYGVKFNGVDSAGIRTYDAATLNWSRSSNEVRGIDDFENLPPFNVKECVTKFNSSTGEREVLAYKGDSGYASAKADTDADVMIEVPCFWYKRPSKWEWIVAPRAKAGFKPSPMHYRNGILYDKVRITKYALNNDFVSQTGYRPRVSTDMNTFRDNLRSKGMYMLDYNTWCSLVILMIIKYSNLDVQNVVGRGKYTGNSTIQSGGADNVLGIDGSPTSITVNESCLTFGIENFFSNIFKYVDGIFLHNLVLYWRDVESMSSDPSDYSELISFYTPVATNTITTSSGNGNVSDIAFDSGFDWMQFPISSSSSNPTGDTWWIQNNMLACCCMGGDAWENLACGLFCFAADSSVGFTSIGIGTMGIEF